MREMNFYLPSSFPQVQVDERRTTFKMRIYDYLVFGIGMNDDKIKYKKREESKEKKQTLRML